MNYQTVYGAIIRKDTRLYFLADSKDDDNDMMCCIYKRRMYISRFKEINNYNQKIYECIVEALALMNKHKMQKKYKHFIKKKMMKQYNEELMNIIDKLDEKYIGEVIID